MERERDEVLSLISRSIERVSEAERERDKLKSLLREYIELWEPDKMKFPDIYNKISALREAVEDKK